MLDHCSGLTSLELEHKEQAVEHSVDVYFSADVETDGPIPGPYSMLSFALVYAGSFDGSSFLRPSSYDHILYEELRPISANFEPEALAVNGLDRDRLCIEGLAPEDAMKQASEWVDLKARGGRAVLVAYPLSFDWAWLYWYFIRFSALGSPFGHSRCFDIKTAVSIKTRKPISESSRSRLPSFLRPRHRHTHRAIDDAIAQAEIFANVFEWGKDDGGIV